MLAALAILGSLGTGCVDRAAQAQAKVTAEFLADTTKTVSTERVTSETLSETIEISGEVTASEDTPLSSRQGGRIVAVYVRDGDPVTEGQLLARQETAPFEDQLRQAKASLAQAIAAEDQAKSSLAQAQRSARVGPQKSSSGLRQAEAQYRAARAAYDRVMAGARPEERRQAEANVESARISLETFQKELRRTERLVAAGAVAGKEIDTQRSQVAAAEATFQNAAQSLAILRNGGRKEEIDQAHEQVKQAEEAVHLAEAERRLDPSLQDAIRAAQAQVRNVQAQAESGRAQVSIAEQALRDTEIRAPFAGVVSGRPMQVGTIASPGVAIARVIGGRGMYVIGQLPSSKAARVREGMAVAVRAEAFALVGKVVAIGAAAQGTGRLLDLRIELAKVPKGVKPGMFANGRITVQKVLAQVVSANALLKDGARNYVFIDRNGIARERKVMVGIAEGSRRQVFGVAEGERVVVRGQEGLTDGDKLRVERQPNSEGGK